MPMEYSISAFSCTALWIVSHISRFPSSVVSKTRKNNGFAKSSYPAGMNFLGILLTPVHLKACRGFSQHKTMELTTVRPNFSQFQSLKIGNGQISCSSETSTDVFRSYILRVIGKYSVGREEQAIPALH